MARKLEDIAKEVYGEDSKYIIKSFDVIGDIAVIKIPAELVDDRRFKFGSEILRNFPYIKVVFRQKSPIEGLFRLRQLEHLAGEYRTETIYKEHGFRYLVDIAKVYFTPRLSYERKRITEQVDEDEIVFNMFAGVGPFTIPIAKKGAYVHSVDINPHAIEYHLANILLNKVEDNIVLYREDSKKIALKSLVNSVDRVIMPLPELALEYLRYAVETISSEGWIHVYLHQEYKEKEEEAISSAISKVKSRIEMLGAKIDKIYGRVVREVAKRTGQVCVDVRIIK